MTTTAMLWGATGQDSSYLSEFLLEKDYKVIGVKRRSSTNTTGRLDGVLDNPNFSLAEGDIVDPSSVNKLVSDYKPDEIFSLAAQSHVQTSFSQPFYTFQVNALGTMNILEAVRNYSPHSKILHASTSELFGSNYNTDQDNVKYQDENTTFSPNSPYAVAKLAAHELVRLYRDAYGIYACAAISFNHESPRRGEEFVTRKITQWIGKFFQWSLGDFRGHKFDKHDLMFDNNNILYIHDNKIIVDRFPKLRLGNIDTVRDWSHAKDMVRGMWMMLQQDKPKEYVLCSGKGHSVREFLDLAFSCIGIKDWEPYIIIDPKFYRPCEVEFLQGRYDRANSELGWEPQISFEELVKEMVESDIEGAKL